MIIIDTKTIGNKKIQIVVDESPFSPRDDDNLGTMICFHRKYNLGDKHNYNKDEYGSWNELLKDIDKKEKAHAILPLYLYDHSGITISTTPFNDRWDSMMVGYIYVTKEKVRNTFGVKRISPKLNETILEILNNEVKVYDQYLIGDVYGYRILNENNELLDSCYGYYGTENCMNEAKNALEYLT